MTSIRLERIVPLDVPDAAICEDGVCEIPVVEPVARRPEPVEGATPAKS